MLELVWPSMRCSTGNVDDNCTVPSMRSVVVRSPLVTVAVLKIDGVAIADVDFGLRTAIATAAPPASATQTTISGDRDLGDAWVSTTSQLPRSASVGGRRAARAAGYRPAMAPIASAATTPPPMAMGGTTIFQCLVDA